MPTAMNLATPTFMALGVAALALMLSVIVGVKKLASHDDHDDHQVIYAGHHGHHRRRREIDDAMPYQGWPEYVPKAEDPSRVIWDSHFLKPRDDGLVALYQRVCCARAFVHCPSDDASPAAKEAACGL
ncbi:hypothetical protein EVAR_12278_1 [Eumeta japonica]|uniref:Uncharacterized protein n=1 Tax=Eumeta variegata TaxID=151549 RepID=A0A4C1TUI4_EUMVA|nr:hypothetical protein EVAR_12278_1 [Eumeta japonica]